MENIPSYLGHALYLSVGMKSIWVCPEGLWCWKNKSKTVGNCFIEKMSNSYDDGGETSHFPGENKATGPLLSHFWTNNSSSYTVLGKSSDERHANRTRTALWYTYKRCSPQWALRLRDSQQKERKEQGRDLLRATEVDRCTTVIQIAFIPVTQSEIFEKGAHAYCNLVSTSI